MIWPLRASHFPTKIPSKIRAFFQTPPKTTFGHLLAAPGCQKVAVFVFVVVVFGAPLVFQGSPKSPQVKCAQKHGRIR